MEEEERKQLERKRLVTILYASFGVTLFIPCALFITLLYGMIGDTPFGNVHIFCELIQLTYIVFHRFESLCIVITVLLVLVFTSPMVVYLIHMIRGILLVRSTETNTQHLSKCRSWCSALKIFRWLIILEALGFILLDSDYFEIKLCFFTALIVQFVIRTSAVRRLKHFMELLTWRNPVTSGGDILFMTAGSLESLRVDPPPSSFSEIEPSAPVLTSEEITSDIDTVNPGMGMYDVPPPSYRKATRVKHKIIAGRDNPPNYEDVIQE